MEKQITFEHYLRQLGHTPKTVKSYMYAKSVFINDNPNPDGYNYKEILNYLNEKGKQNADKKVKGYILNSIKKYYDYLVEIGKRNDHPCRNLHIRNTRRKEILHQDLFASDELELLLQREERYADLKQRNQVVMSLLVYQGLNSAEIANLNLRHIDFDAGRIFIRASSKISQRHLEMHNKQFRIFERYINEGRKKLQREETEALLLGKLGNRIGVEDINYLTSTFKPLFPDRNLNPLTIRQSVIANWLNEKKIPLEQVQLMSGQKWISSTIKYRQTSMEEQREMMNKWFPI
jgi:site-specific recombinase XerD